MAAPNVANISIGSLSANCSGVFSGPPAVCVGNLGPHNGNTIGTQILPFTLGQQFIFHEDIDQSASNSGGASSGHSAMGSVDFGFTLLEANGTPVQIQAVPEHDSIVLLALGLIALFLASQWK